MRICAAAISQSDMISVPRPDIMRVTVSAGGRFHAFNLAAELLRLGHSVRLITSYPKFHARRYGLPREVVTSLPLKEIFQRVLVKLPARLQRRGLNFDLAELFDRQAARRVRESDICTIFSGFALHTMQEARRRGAVVIVERGSSHIKYQRDILEEEYTRHGIAVIPVDPRMVEKECAEYAQADYIAIPSTFVRRTFVEKGVAESKLIQVPYGVNVSAFHPGQRTDKTFRLISVGRQSLRKGTHYLIDAFGQLPLPNAELVLVGPLEPEIAPWLSRYGDRVRVVGAVPEASLVDYYGQSSAFALASVEEGMALVLAQAMASGLPVICTTNTGGEDLVRDGIDGFVIPIRDIERLQEKILVLYRDAELCRSLGASARERVNSGFTWGDYGQRVAALYANRFAKHRLMNAAYY